MNKKKNGQGSAKEDDLKNTDAGGKTMWGTTPAGFCKL